MTHDVSWLMYTRRILAPPLFVHRRETTGRDSRKHCDDGVRNPPIKGREWNFHNKVSIHIVGQSKPLPLSQRDPQTKVGVKHPETVHASQQAHVEDCASSLASLPI